MSSSRNRVEQLVQGTTSSPSLVPSEPAIQGGLGLNAASQVFPAVLSPWQHLCHQLFPSGLSQLNCQSLWQGTVFAIWVHTASGLFLPSEKPSPLAPCFIPYLVSLLLQQMLTSSDTGSSLVFFPKSLIFSTSCRSESPFPRSVSYRAWSSSSVSLHSSRKLSALPPRIIATKRGNHVVAEQMVGSDLAEELIYKKEVIS